MNIVADQLNSKANTQAMITCFINDMKQYFKKSPLLSQDKTYSRILKIAETTQKYMPNYYCISNIALKLVSILKTRVTDKFEDLKQQQSQNTNISNQQSKQQNTINNQDIQALDNLRSKFSKQNDASKSATVTLGRQVNQDFMRKLVFDVIDQLKDQIEQCQQTIERLLNQTLNFQSSILFWDSHMSNKAIVNKVATSKNIKITYVKISGADPKLNQINLIDVPSKIRKFQKVIISAQSIMKNGSVISQPGSLMLAIAAKKYNIPVIAISRGFGYTQKVMIDQHLLLADNPMKYFNKTQNSILKVHIAKKFDLLQSKYINQIISQLGKICPSNIEIHFSVYYDYQ